MLWPRCSLTVRVTQVTHLAHERQVAVDVIHRALATDAIPAVRLLGVVADDSCLGFHLEILQRLIEA